MIALVIFSERFSESEWPLHEAVKIAERVTAGKLVAIPVFYRVSIEDVTMFEGKFGECFVETVVRGRGQDHPYGQFWVDSVRFIAEKIGFNSEVYSIDVEEIVKAIKRQLPYLSPAIRTLQRHFAREFLIASLVSAICCYLILH
ncbi:unnamed protein product [Arabis nemorensis]|uniref:TIR domain-containing protein n=1 Tax=Arabis nemorensis TaxID=586526 RepID=A0A565AXN4_9BRAS|nr:unnamed protein product [Arabis nemorensis]